MNGTSVYHQGRPPRDRPCPLGEAQPGLSGLRGWLWRVVESQSVEWHRLYRGGRGVKIQPVSALEWNDLPGGDEGGSIIDRKVVARRPGR